MNVGGLMRAWYTDVLTKLTDPDFGLFKLSVNKTNIQPNPLSVIIPDYLGLFEFAGLMTAKVHLTIFI